MSIDEEKLLSGSYGMNLSGKEMAVLYAIVGNSSTNRADNDLATVGIRYRIASSDDTTMALHRKICSILRNHGVMS